MPRVNAVGTTVVAGTNGAYVPFSQGIHNSLLDPGPSPSGHPRAADAIADFFDRDTVGARIVITNGAVIAP